MWIFTKLFSWSKKEYFHELWSYWNIWGLFSNENSSNMSDDELLALYRGWVFWCSDLIWDGMSWLERQLYKTEQELETIDHDYMKLIDAQLVKAISIFLKTLWIVYLYKETMWLKVTKLLLLKSQNVQATKWVLWEPLYYTYFDWQKFYKFMPEDLIVMKSFSPLFSDSWMTPLKAVSTQVATDLSSVEFNRLFFENGWKPWTIFKHNAKIEWKTRDKYIAKWKEQFAWLKNAHKVAFLDQWIEIVDFSANQKDMELVSQRTFTMDEVLMIFRVPKPLMWKSDWVWFADKNVPWYYFSEYTLKPLAKLIEDELNKQLFDWIGFFSFEFMQDKEELLKEYQWNTITLNQYLLWTWRDAVSWGDRLWDGTEITVIKEKQVETRIEKSLSKWFEKMFETKEFGTEEYNEKVWKTKIARTDVYEDNMIKLQKKIFSAQEKDILANLWDTKAVKEIKKEEDLFDAKKYDLMYSLLYSPYFTKLTKAEWTIAMEEISDEDFAVAKMNPWIGENIDRMSEDIDDVTRKEMFDIIKQWNRDKVWAAQIATSIKAKFNQYTKSKWRVEKIARTEVTRASNKSQDEAYIQSGVVEKKQWYTSLDERVAPECAALHWKEVKTWWIFLKKGDKDSLWNKITYETIKFPPRHVNCRCTLRPIISRKSFEIVKGIMERNWKTFKDLTSE